MLGRMGTPSERERFDMAPDLKGLLLVNLCTGFLLCLFCYQMAERPSLHRNSAGLWIVLQTGGAAAAALLGMLLRRVGLPCLCLSSAALLGLFFPWVHAGSNIWSGDAGMHWLFFVFPACALAALAALAVLLVGIRRAVKAARIRREFPELAGRGR